jgi:hypothetical protein
MPNPTVPASAIALPTRRFLLCSMVAAPVALAPALRGLVPAFDPAAYIAALRSAGVTVAPSHALRSYFLGYGTGGFGDAFFAASERFADAYLADPEAIEKIYLTLCAEEARHD